MKKDVRIIVQNIQRYDDYTDKIVTNAIGNYSRSGSSHSVLYRELCAGGHVVENRLIINPEKANLYRTGSIFTEMSFLNGYLQLIIPQYFISNKSGIWSLSLIVHSKG